MRILIVDDNEDTRTLLCMGLVRDGIEARAVGTVGDARALFAQEHFDAILTDWNLSDATAQSLLDVIGDCPAVILTGDEDALAITWPLHVCALKKPAPLASVIAALSKHRPRQA